MKPDSHHYRPDIDGVRCLAVLLVIAFHCSASLLPGGFVGVDVFFVISGYLISLIIFHDIQNESFGIVRFYGSRIKRIFPALITVVAATLALGWFFLFPCEYRNLGKHVVGAATFTSNLMLWREKGYFDAAAGLKPLLHLWSLGIEAQFYLFFPIAIWLIKRLGMATTRCLGTILVFSLAISVYGALTYPSATFYLPVTRLWELLIGCTLASLENERSGLPPGQPRKRIYFSGNESNLLFRNALSWLGVGMIVGAAFFITPTRPFPGGWAVIPTIGTALVISAGTRSFLNRRILSHKPLVGVGLISYPLYLWHWPLLSFARVIFQGNLSNLTIAGIIIISGLLAWLTYWHIERPIRSGARPGAQKVIQLCYCMAGLLVLGALTGMNMWPSRIGMSPLGKQVNAATTDWNYPFVDNFQRLNGFQKDLEMGQDSAEPATLFIGDSHIQQYWPRLDLVLKQRPDASSRPVIFITAGGSPALPNVNRVQPGYACDKFFDFAMREAVKPNVGTVVFGCFWEKYFIGCFPGGKAEAIYRINDPQRNPVRLESAAANQVFAGFGHAIATLAAMHKQVVVILPGPSSQNWNPDSISRVPFQTAGASQFRVARKDFEAFLYPLKQRLIDVVVVNGGKVIDPLDYFEEDGILNGQTAQGDFRFKDDNHIRPFYAIERATFLDSLIKNRVVSKR